MEGRKKENEGDFEGRRKQRVEDVSKLLNTSSFIDMCVYIDISLLGCNKPNPKAKDNNEGGKNGGERRVSRKGPGRTLEKLDMIYLYDYIGLLYVIFIVYTFLL